MEAYNRLEYLDLSENEIVEIKPHCFRESSEMLTLNLRQNRIGTVDHNDLEGLAHLVTLNMAENSIDNITAKAFIWSEGLQSINLASNKLDGLHPDTFDGSVRETLRGLDLSNNYFRSIPREALTGLIDLTILDFSGNSLGKIDSGEFQKIGGKLMELKLSGCQLYNVGAAAFYGLESLKKLDLSNNGLTETPNRAFNNLGMLEELKIGRNKIKTFGKKDFLSLKNLKHFRLEGCNGGSLNLNEGVFAENTNLESIVIKCPDLKTISDQLSLNHLSVLKSLNFHGSGLENIPENLVNYYDIAELDLSSNPLHCDCQLKFLFNLLVQPGPLQLSGICASPAKLANTNIARLREKDYKCDSSSKKGPLVAGLSVAAVLGVALSVLAFFWWKKKPWNLSLFKHSKKKKRLSAHFSGDKKDIKVLQNEDIDATEGFLQLSGLADYGNGEQSENLYAEVAEVTETVPKYSIPLTNVQCPDVKISVL
eukprot:GFUD01031945.1.p1 GENE.GFUD01031945.1~~GFUD01031945.1.p1  ORF type:complete len:556 (+),score=149.18 GFUD01031945.1:228-1670(+)